MATLAGVRGASFQVLVLHVGRVSVIDATGFVALDNAIGSVVRDGKHVVLAGPLPKPRAIFDKAGLEAKYPNLRVADSLESALRLAAERVAKITSAGSGDSSDRLRSSA
jgi:SulP family sulfate permease